MAQHPLPPTAAASAVQPSRARAARADDLQHIPWMATLDGAERQRVRHDLRLVQVDAGELVCRVGRPVTYWFGLVDGLLKMSNDAAGADGRASPITFTGVSPGGWFGEGTVLKDEVYRYNIQALRQSVVAGITADTFHWLLGRSIGFNRFVMNQLNERLGQFIAAREIDRLTHPDETGGAQPGRAVPPRALPRRGRGAAHHAAGTGLSGGPEPPACERGADGLAGGGCHPRGVRRRAGAGPRGLAGLSLSLSGGRLQYRPAPAEKPGGAAVAAPHQPFAPRMALLLSAPARRLLMPSDRFQPRRWTASLAAVLRSLKFRIAMGGMLAVALAIGLTTAQLLHRAERDLLQAARQAGLVEVVRSARLLDERLRQSQQLLHHSIRQVPAGPPTDLPALRAFIESAAMLRASFDAVSVADRDGRLAIRWDGKDYREWGGSLADRAYFKTAVGEGRPAASDLIISRVNGQPMVVLAHPVHQEGQVVAVLIGTLELRRRDLAGAITEAGSEAGSEEDAGQMTVVTDAQGQIMAHPDPAHIGLPGLAEPRLQAAMAQWREAGQPLEPSGLELNDAASLVTVAAVPGADWMVWRVRPLDVVLAPLKAARSQALVDALALLAATGSVLLLLLWWLLRPLDRLRARSQHLFDGSLDPHEGWPAAGGEIGELSRVLRHVSAERAQLEAFNGDVMQRLQSVMANAPVGIAFTRTGTFELVSGELCRLLGRAEHELLGQPGRIIYASNEEYELLGPRVAAAFAAGQAFDGELLFRRGTKGQFPGRLRGMPVDRTASANGTIWTLTDITAEVAARQSLEWAASHDTLTGLANRKAFEQHIARLHAALPRSCPAALLLLDLDRFKPINDKHGHAAGDAMLRAVGITIQSHIRHGDLAVRLGGDEFAVLLERCSVDIALRVAEDIRSAVAGERVLWQEHSLSVGISVGVAALDKDLVAAADWVAAADMACYEAKASGRNRVHLATLHESAERAAAAKAVARLRLVAGAEPTSV